jgi:hypothetical protein
MSAGVAGLKLSKKGLPPGKATGMVNDLPLTRIIQMGELAPLAFAAPCASHHMFQRSGRYQ